MVQVDGKVRDRVEVAPDAAEDDLRELALASERVRAALGDRRVARVVVVPPKLVNLVTAHDGAPHQLELGPVAGVAVDRARA